MGLLWISKLNRVRLLLFLLALPIYHELLLLIWDNYSRLDENPLVFVVPALMLAPVVGLVRFMDGSEPNSSSGFTRVGLAIFALFPLVLVLAHSLPEESLLFHLEMIVLGLGTLVIICAELFFLGLCGAVIFRRGEYSSRIVDRFVSSIRALLITYPRDSLLLLLIAPLSPLMLVAVLSYVIMNLFTVRIADPKIIV